MNALPCLSRLSALTFSIVTLLGFASHAAPVTTQTFSLQAGWNAVHLELTPTDTRPTAAFAGLPLDSAWALQSRVSAVDYISDPNEPVWNKERWNYFVPTNRPESLGSRLSAVLGQRTYLIKLTTAATWTVTGTPAVSPIKWSPNSYNFVGFPLDPASPPTFDSFFRPSTAHFNTTNQQVRPIYRLNTSGQWTLVTGNQTMKSGEAYWVFCNGGSDYQGPLEVQTEFGTGLDFGTQLDAASLHLLNRSTTGTTNLLTDLLGGGTGPLKYQQFDAANGFTWQTLGGSLNLPGGSGTNIALRLAPARAQMAGPKFETILSVNNQRGVRWLVPLTVLRGLPNDPSPSQLNGIASRGGVSLMDVRPMDLGSDAKNYAGLWVGSATVTAISEAHSGSLVTNGFLSLPLENSDGTVSSNVPISIFRTNVVLTPRPVQAPAELRLLVHVDTNGTTRFLKEVIQLWQDGTTTNNADGLAVTATPGRYVLLTEDSLIPQYKGAGLRDGQLVGRRLSTVAFDFPSSPGANYLVMNGGLAISNTVSASIVVPSDFATNPFRHRFHPDHNDVAESYEIHRDIALQVSPPPLQNPPPEYGVKVLGGIYTEVVGGLHKTNIVVAGTFQLRKVSTVGVLNQ
jgi:hypothetical protein